MSLVVYDMGKRIETPVRPPSRRITASQATAAIHPVNEQASHSGSPSASASGIEAYRQQQEKHPATVAFIRDILHRNVATLTPNDTLAEAREKLQQTGFHNLPIVNLEQQVLAIFSEGDLLRALIKQPQPTPAHFWQSNIMNFASRPVFCVQEQTDIHQASKLLYEYNIGALPVLNHHNQLCGIITRSDILRLLSHYGPLEFWA